MGIKFINPTEHIVYSAGMGIVCAPGDTVEVKECWALRRKKAGTKAKYNNAKNSLPSILSQQVPQLEPATEADAKRLNSEFLDESQRYGEAASLDKIARLQRLGLPKELVTVLSDEKLAEMEGIESAKTLPPVEVDQAAGIQDTAAVEDAIAKYEAEEKEAPKPEKKSGKKAPRS